MLAFTQGLATQRMLTEARKASLPGTCMGLNTEKGRTRLRLTKTQSDISPCTCLRLKNAMPNLLKLLKMQNTVINLIDAHTQEIKDSKKENDYKREPIPSIFFLQF